jgi:hypothetical protein
MRRLPSPTSMMDRLDRAARLSSFTPRLEFESFRALPCGCVAGEYRALPEAFNLLRVDAKGPHCRRREHELDQVLGILVDNDEDE